MEPFKALTKEFILHSLSRRGQAEWNLIVELIIIVSLSDHAGVLLNQQELVPV